MDAASIPLKGAIFVVPLDSHTYEIEIPLDFCFGKSEKCSVKQNSARQAD